MYHSHKVRIENLSTADLVWTHRWLLAKIQKENIVIYVTGIDMSSAFDTIRREKLIDILKTIIDEDEIRMIRYLLANTTLEVKMTNVETLPFESNIGSPQGDGLSGVLFNVYFEFSLRKVRTSIEYTKRLTSQPINICNNSNFPKESIYADDYDNITTNFEVKRKFKL